MEENLVRSACVFVLSTFISDNSHRPSPVPSYDVWVPDGGSMAEAQNNIGVHHGWRSNCPWPGKEERKLAWQLPRQYACRGGPSIAAETTTVAANRRTRPGAAGWTHPSSACTQGAQKFGQLPAWNSSFAAAKRPVASAARYSAESEPNTSSNWTGRTTARMTCYRDPTAARSCCGRSPRPHHRKGPRLWRAANSIFQSRIGIRSIVATFKRIAVPPLAPKL